jgi:hypothetical protein
MKIKKSITLYPDYYNGKKNEIYLFSAYNNYLEHSRKIILPTIYFHLKYYKNIRFHDFLFVLILLVETFLKKIKINFSIIKYYFKLNNVGELIVTCSYNKMTSHILEIAKKNGIKTIEIQHGHLLKEHAFYKLGIPFIEEYWCWNEDYAALIKIFEPKVNTKIVGFPFSKTNLLEKQKKINSILIIDQWSIRDEIVDFSKEIIKNNPDLRITYKLHPNKKFWPKKELFAINDNIVILKSQDRIIDICSSYDAVIGAYSTGLIEAKLNNIPTFLFQGYEDEILLTNKIVQPFQDLNKSL